ncbi:MAG: excinuclease ABC subunit UvrA [Flavobacteriales bacterium]|nr:excinuclease ABC subunit UvrA [Flavobacteriales bacterium]
MPVKNTPSIKSHILIEGARVHNLKNVSVAVPRNKLVVVTGLSGSGKSSLAFDTLYAEGQRRYVESLSSYARQFLGRLDKPEVDNIRGISPAVAIEQKVISRNPRSTVGTVTEIYDYLKLLFARAGKTYSPISGKEVKKESVSDVVDYVKQLPQGTRVILYAPLIRKNDRTHQKQLELLMQQGFTRVEVNGEVYAMEEVLQRKFKNSDELFVMIDRFVAENNNDENDSRVADSAETAFFEGDGECFLEVQDAKKTRKKFNKRFEADGMSFEEPDVHFFTFNNPIGACKTCEGFGSVIGIDPDLVIPNKALSIYEDAVACWKGETMGEWKKQLIKNAEKFNFPIHKPISQLSKEQMNVLWKGNKYFDGLDAFFLHLEANMYKIQYRVMLSRYRGKTTCPDCLGTRLRKDAQYVKIGGKSISDLLFEPIKELIPFFDTLKLGKHEEKIAQRILVEIRSRLKFLNDVGLGYLTLNRTANTLSGGESQRINLATSLGSSLVGSMYILDEPSIGLHPRDTQKLIGVLQTLRDLGNTVIVVEHDVEVMRAADEIIDMGPMAGSHGGEVVFQGDHSELLSAKKSMTAKYLTGKESIDAPDKKRKWKDYIQVTGARENNLKDITVKFPLGVMTVVTGVSGSGKSSLVKRVLYPAITKALGGHGDKNGAFDKLEGSFRQLKSVEFIDQNPIGKSSRSNPVTYVKAFDEIRNLFAAQQGSKVKGFKASHFSFNVDGGRCEVCEGEGIITVEMQFMADVHLVCEECNGKRYRDEVLEVTFHEKSIFDVLQMTIDDAITFFQQHSKGKGDTESKIVQKLLPLQDVGLGYVQLGQSSSTLSGGEAQRIKLASFLGNEKGDNNTLFIFDEPTTGLHFHDVKKLLHAMNALIDRGNSVLIIEHNTDVIKCADWVIDLGPEGGDEGGFILYEGLPEDLKKIKKSYTGKFLSEG